MRLRPLFGAMAFLLGCGADEPPLRQQSVPAPEGGEDSCYPPLSDPAWHRVDGDVSSIQARSGSWFLARASTEPGTYNKVGCAAVAWCDDGTMRRRSGTVITPDDGTGWTPWFMGQLGQNDACLPAVVLRAEFAHLPLGVACIDD